MKDEVLHGLLAARTLFDAARRYCFVRDRYVASAGLVVLQDALELVLYSSLLQLGIDESKAVEGFSFDQLIGELRKQGFPVAKSGTLKAMNKQRVLIKHHAQLAEPMAVQNYYQACVLASDALLTSLLGKSLRDVVVANVIKDDRVIEHIEASGVAIEDGRWLDSLIATRKALFISYESDYDIREWNQPPESRNFLLLVGRRRKAPEFARTPEWIEQNVEDPTDYIVLDHDRVRSEMLEIGMDPQEFFNVWRLAPSVYLHPEHGWAIETSPSNVDAATEDNARYCLDVVVSLIRRKETHDEIVRTAPRSSVRWSALLLREQALLPRAAREAEGSSSVTLQAGSRYTVSRIVSGLDGNEKFVRIADFGSAPNSFLWGYIPYEACTIEESVD